MAFENGAFSATLAAAAGDDAALHAELRLAFRESLEQQLDLLRRARCDGNWVVAAQRIKGLAASFHVEPLMLLADEAIEAAPGDPVVLRQIDTFLTDFDADPAI
ncbi:Hpt domain-containing protein [Parerythrobacter jejuensis]|uniref:Hpt domain-containing protein n=1 Tax=Parerythrobacter jejuensis TaxID=795812 RepID=A0A845AS87_9SPHN|nr:Hpt domain-containing protein [Parerythrobacter jejuensis]MXP32444.1 Hpt domain-containing protein [Parerythrobacter jejuensis]